jgi:hypothetical protein
MKLKDITVGMPVSLYTPSGFVNTSLIGIVLAVPDPKRVQVMFTDGRQFYYHPRHLRQVK